MRRSIAAAIVTTAASIETRVRAVMGEWGVKPMNPAHVFQLDGVVDNSQQGWLTFSYSALNRFVWGWGQEVV